MPRSSEEIPSQTGPSGEPEILNLPGPDQVEHADSNSLEESSPGSTLIEFPGVNRRAEPAWRRELSRRVREVQDRRAREAIDSPVGVRPPPAKDPVLSQLELVPELPTPAMNQLVENALRRVERARRADSVETQSLSSGPVSQYGAATAVARAKAKAPVVESLPFVDEPEAVPSKAPRRSLTRRKLAIVPTREPVPEPTPGPVFEKPTTKPVRLITGAVDDVALSYLDNHFPETHAAVDFTHARSSRRMMSAICDGLFVAILAAPFAAGIELARADWTDPRTMGAMIGAFAFVMLVYETFSIGLKGRTWGMRLFSLRVVDSGTGLIPTGGQSIKRAITYVFSLVPVGLGFLFTFLDSDGVLPHDRFSRTIVVRD